jgi:hypothetical protein
VLEGKTAKEFMGNDSKKVLCCSRLFGLRWDMECFLEDIGCCHVSAALPLVLEGMGWDLKRMRRGLMEFEWISREFEGNFVEILRKIEEISRKRQRNLKENQEISSNCFHKSTRVP